MKAGSIVTFGDLNVDWTIRGNLELSWLDLAENGVTMLQEILEEPGGGAFSFARKAREAGKSVTVIGAVGQDPAGVWLFEKIKYIGATPLVSLIRGKPTGRCFIARDKRDVRLLINSLDNANHYLCESELVYAKESILNASIVHVPGFCLRNPTMPRYHAVRQVFDWMEKYSTPPMLVFDVVPHRIYELMKWEEFVAMCKPVQVLISEVATIRRFLCMGNRHELINVEVAFEVLERLKPFFPCIVLRFGPSGCDEELRWDSRFERIEHVVDTGHGSAVDKRGIGDQLTLSALESFFRLI